MNWTTIAIELGIIIGLATIICGLMFAVTIPYVTSIQAKTVLSIAAIIMVTLIYFSVQLAWISNPFVAIGMVVLCVVTGGVTSLIDEKKQKRTVMIEDESWHAEG